MQWSKCARPGSNLTCLSRQVSGRDVLWSMLLELLLKDNSFLVKNCWFVCWWQKALRLSVVIKKKNVFKQRIKIIIKSLWYLTLVRWMKDVAANGYQTLSHTHTPTNYYNPAAHACRGLIRSFPLLIHKLFSDLCGSRHVPPPPPILPPLVIAHVSILHTFTLYTCTFP